MTPLLGLYSLLVVVAGRSLIFNDVLPRGKPNSKVLRGYEVEDIEFDSFDGTTLRGWFVRAGNNRAKRTLVLLHGWRRDRLSLVPHIKLFVDAGFHVLAYDQRGHGASDTAMITFGVDEAKDLIAAVGFLSGRGDVAVDRLGACGFSLGSAAIAYSAATAREKPFKAAVFEGVFADSFDVGRYVLELRFGLLLGRLIEHFVFTAGHAVSSLSRFRHSRPVDQIGRIAPTQIMIIRGENDDVVPESSAMRLIRAARQPKTVWLHSGGGHTDSYLIDPDEYGRRVLGFLNANI